MNDIIIYHSPLSIYGRYRRYAPYDMGHICAVHSLNMIGQNAVQSSTIVEILFAFIPNKYNLFIQTK